MNNSILSKFQRELPVPKLPPKIKHHYQEKNLYFLLGDYLSNYLELLNPGLERQTVIVCIGTDRSTGDSLGPLVGTKLLERRLDGLIVHGTLEDPVHAANINDKMALLKEHQDPFILAIDASLGKTESVGCITLGPGAVKPGAGVNKKLPQVGDVHFTGIVNVGGYMEYFVLQNTRLNIVMDMANTITDSIAFTWHRLQRRKKSNIYSEQN